MYIIGEFTFKVPGILTCKCNKKEFSFLLVSRGTWEGAGSRVGVQTSL
jgi:hypothetical protein